MTVATEPRTRGDEMILGAGLLAGAANVIMQLSRPGVGYGVVESRVESGQIFRHPIKRTRTTLTYLAVATMGTDEEKKHFRNGVNRAHAQVRSTASSPVSYNAFDPELQLWVAACLYKGVEDTLRIFGGEITPGQAEDLYRECAALGTTLQVREDMWPADRAAFEEYWNAALEKVCIDDTVRDYLQELTVLNFLPAPLSRVFGPLNRFITTGFLPQRFREEMRLHWSDRHQRRFDRSMSAMGAVLLRMPAAVRAFPYNYYLWDLRRRIKSGKPLV